MCQSYRPDPVALAMDAFGLSWRDITFYAFPPFSVVARVRSAEGPARRGLGDAGGAGLANTGVVPCGSTPAGGPCPSTL